MLNSIPKAQGKPLVSAEKAYEFYLNEVHYIDDEYNEKKDKKVIRSSNAGRCHKLHAYHLSDVEPKPIDNKTKRIFRIGEVFHNEVQEGFSWLMNVKNKSKLNYEIMQEKMVPLEINGMIIEGHFDNILIDHNRKKITVYDWKTMNPRSYSYFIKKPEDKEGYVIQLATYAMGLMKIERFAEYTINVCIVGFNKDTGDFYEACWDANHVIPVAFQYWSELSEFVEKFRLEPSEEIINEETEETVPAYNFDFDNMIAGVTPNVPVNNKWECNYCSYNHVCNSKYIKRI